MTAVAKITSKGQTTIPADIRVALQLAPGDKLAWEVRQAMAYQVAKVIAAMAAVLRGQVVAVILSGWLGQGRDLAGGIAARVQFLGPVLVHAGEDDMSALALSALRALADPGVTLAYPPGAAAESA